MAMATVGEKTRKRDNEKLFLQDFDASLLETPPRTENELLSIYCKNSDVLYMYLQESVTRYLDPLSNEIRAMLGHLASYRISNCTKRELNKAFGHLRRFTLDGLKILCDEFDKGLSLELLVQTKYDLRNIEQNYPCNFAELLLDARKAYLDAQTEESVGSDLGVHKQIEHYYIAAKKYVEAKLYYQQHKKSITRVIIWTWVKRCAVAAMALFGIGVTIVQMLI